MLSIKKMHVCGYVFEKKFSKLMQSGGLQNKLQFV